NEVDDTLAMKRSVFGRFHFRVKKNEPYMLSFIQRGSITKEVVVDANDLPLMHRDMRVRHLRFDVTMKEGDPEAHLRYAHPVGYIRFKPHTGRVQVEYDSALERTANEAR